MTELVRRDFLVEIGTEELPPTALRGLELAFAQGIRAGIEKAGLAHQNIRSFATPRRLAVLVTRLASCQPDQAIRRRGPPVNTAFDSTGQPTRAALAFAQSCGVPVEALEKLEEGKGTFVFFTGTRPGATTTNLLPQIVQASLDSLPIPRRMRWGSGNAQFVRPVHWVVMLYGKEVIPGTLLETSAGNLTRGHRFHASKPIRVPTPGAYERTLRERGFVLADFAARREVIREKVTALATLLDGKAVFDAALLDEVTALVEWPVPLAGRFEERFLQLPREVLISTLADHQRYFALEDAQGRLMSGFITVSNIDSRDPAKVREGNERVVRPRLADAAFFWTQDRKQPLCAHREALESMTYQAKLGSLGDKTRRIRALAGEIATVIASDRAEAERAAELCKCDLLTAMVGEFPELQGIMGTYYALADGEAPEVAVAIREHYLPRSAGDELPQTHAGLAVALADKLDTLAGIFAIHEKPTGTKDPFGLRRAAIGLLRILIEKRLDLDLRVLIVGSLAGVQADIERLAKLRTPGGSSVAATQSSSSGASGHTPGKDPVKDVLADQIYDFVMERLRAYYLERDASTAEPVGVEGQRSTALGGQPVLTTEMFDAVLATKPASPVDFAARLQALGAFLQLPEAASLTAANKRIANILRKAGELQRSQIRLEHLREPAEIRLFDTICALRQSVAASLAQREYANALGQLAQLRPPLDAFFDQVMVMEEDPTLRANRLELLAQLHGLFIGIVDLSRLPG